ncbi:OX-2 membrane glycoprotein-like isoform X2 [Hemicordylus capensis]|uniref:OX-2 membrane glycoprotein-like isoform X2 n=1 Tax=Hemicordylus capensis TaxID=884348 RepID=UPI0023042B10|nr:OX-2 membrane glycoprotein-like isoform X2 [Hemicordylus capensis]
MLFKVNEDFSSPWTFQGLIVGIISILFSSAQGSIEPQNEAVELGGNVSLRCVLKETLEVTQVTWQKKIDGNFDNIGTYGKGKNQTINNGYKGKVNIRVLELKETAITFWNVSIQENACYRCIFNTLTGPISKEPCLDVYDHLRSFLHYRISDGHLNATCFATGLPRPNISWVPARGEKTENEIINPNGTLSVISSILVNTSDSQYAQDLICKVSHRGVEREFKVPMKEKGF